METHRKEDCFLGKSKRDAQAPEEKAKEKTRERRRQLSFVLLYLFHSGLAGFVPSGVHSVRLSEKSCRSGAHVKTGGERMKTGELGSMTSEL